MKVSQITDNIITSEIIDRVLFEDLEDNHKNADCIVVLGSSKATKYRVPAAVSAYKAGRSGTLMFCGGKKIPVEGKIKTEAELMQDKAIELGVPASKIILDNNSLNTIENILFSIVELQRHFMLNNVKSILLVTTGYHMRRSLAITNYLYPKHIVVYPCPVDDTNTTRTNWMNTDAGYNRAKSEVLKIASYVNEGVFPDFEIEFN